MYLVVDLDNIFEYIICVKQCVENCMATNLALDEDLLIEALEVGHLRTKKDTVTLALKEFIARRKQKKIFELFGSIDYDAKYDYKKMRSR